MGPLDSNDDLSIESVISVILSKLSRCLHPIETKYKTLVVWVKYL